MADTKFALRSINEPNDPCLHCGRGQAEHMPTGKCPGSNNHPNRKPMTPDRIKAVLQQEVRTLRDAGNRYGSEVLQKFIDQATDSELLRFREIIRAA